MGFSGRPSGFKKSGGRFNGVDGIISGYEFVTEHPFSKGGRKKSEFNPLYFVLKGRVDGADVDTPDVMLFASADDFIISEGGQVLTPVDDSVALRESFQGVRFIGSLTKPAIGDGFPEDRFPLGVVDYRAAIGTRVRFGQALQYDKAGKVKQRKSEKDGKMYNDTTTVIEEVYSLPVADVKTNGKAATGTSAKVKSAGVGEVAATSLKSYLKAAGGELPKAKVRMRVLQDEQFKGNADLRDDVIKWLASDDNLGNIDGVTFDVADKAQTLALNG